MHWWRSTARARPRRTHPIDVHEHGGKWMLYLEYPLNALITGGVALSAGTPMPPLTTTEVGSRSWLTLMT
jgi:hypothetical protein